MGVGVEEKCGNQEEVKTSHKKMGLGVLEHSEWVSHSEHCEEVYGVLLTLREADSRAEVPKSDLEAAEKEAQRLLAQEKATMDGETLWDPQPRYSWEPLELGGPVNGVLIGKWGSQS